MKHKLRTGLFSDGGHPRRSESTSARTFLRRHPSRARATMDTTPKSTGYGLTYSRRAEVCRVQKLAPLAGLNVGYDRW